VLPSGATEILAGVSAAAGAVALAGGLAALAAGRRLAGEREADPRGRARFLAEIGLLGSVIFLAVIVLGGVALVPLDVCDPG
jgi:hypothetical protein